VIGEIAFPGVRDRHGDHEHWPGILIGLRAFHEFEKASRVVTKSEGHPADGDGLSRIGDLRLFTASDQRNGRDQTNSQSQLARS
jgi:hypothetical protein